MVSHSFLLSYWTEELSQNDAEHFLSAVAKFLVEHSASTDAFHVHYDIVLVAACI